MKTQQLIGKVISVALAAILVIGGGTTVFAAETIGCDDPKTVELDGYNTKVNYTFRPETDGDYQFTSSDISDEDLKPAISIYRSGKLRLVRALIKSIVEILSDLFFVIEKYRKYRKHLSHNSSAYRYAEAVKLLPHGLLKINLNI